MKKNKTSFIFLTLIFISSCGGKKVIQKPTEDLTKKEEIVWRSHDKRPEWTIKEPFEKEGNLFFIGLSDKLATEKESRESALRSAISNVVKYIGTDVKEKFQSIQAASGLSTDILDPTVATRKFEEFFADAVARRVKAAEWYIEKWERKYKNRNEYFFSVFVLAQADKAELDNSIKEQLAEQQKRCNAAKSANEILSKANDCLTEGEQKMQSSPGSASVKFKETIKLADQAKWKTAEFPELKEITKSADNMISSSKEKLNKLMEMNVHWTIICLLPKNKNLTKYRSMVETEVANMISTKGYNIVTSEDIGVNELDEETYERLKYRAGTMVVGTYSTEFMGDKFTLPGGKVTDYIPCYYGKISAKIMNLHTKKVTSSKNVKEKGFSSTKDDAELKCLKKAAKSIAEGFVDNLPKPK